MTRSDDTSEFDAEAERRFVERVIAGEAEAEREFVRRLGCVPRFLRHRNRLRGSPLSEHELEDAIQDTIAIAVQKLPGFQPRVRLESWLFGICAYQMIHAIRKKRPTRDVADLEEVEDGSGKPSWKALDDHVEAEALLNRLGGEGAEILRLKHLEGLTFDEIADRLSLPASSVKSTYYRGLARLQANLGVAPERPESDR